MPGIHTRLTSRPNRLEIPDDLAGRQIDGLYRGLLFIAALALPIAIMAFAGECLPGEPTYAANRDSGAIVVLAKKQTRSLSQSE